MRPELDLNLECQDCGEVVRRLSSAEAQKVAHNPYNYIVFCAPCRLANERLDLPL